MKTILEICREVADLAATKRPDNLFDANSQQESIFLSVAKSALDSLLRYGDWQELTKEGCLRTVEGRTQYPISEFLPDFYCLLNNTIFIKDSKERIIGAITPEQWMREKYFYSSGNELKFKIQNGRVVWDFDTFEEKSSLTSNTDVPVFDEYLVKLNILWRWLKRSGLDYGEEYDEFQRELKKRFGSEHSSSDINLAKSAECAELGGVIINEVKIGNTGQ